MRYLNLTRKNLMMTAWLVVLIFLFSGFILAEVQTYPTVKRGDCIQLSQSFYNSTFQNISTILQPNKQFLILNVPMSNVGGGFFNYTFCNTTQDGEYLVNGYGDKNGVIESWVYNFFVTKTGVILTPSESYFYIFFIVLLFIFIMFMVYLSTTIPLKNDSNPDGTITKITKKKYLKLLTMEFTFGLILLFINLLAGLFNSFTSFSFLSSLIDGIYLFFLVTTYGATFIIFTIMFIMIYWDIWIAIDIKKWGEYVGKE